MWICSFLLTCFEDSITIGVMKRSKKVTKKTVASRKAVRKTANDTTTKTAGSKKMTIKEYAEREGIVYERLFSGQNPNMSMQTYLKRIGLPNTAKVFRMLNNEKA